MAITYDQRRQTVQTTSGLDMIAGIWLILAPFLLGYSGVSAALWNDIVLGVAVIVLSGIRTTEEGMKMSWASWLSVAVGIWLVIAPFALGYSANSRALWNDIILGVIVGILALWSALSSPKEV